MRKITIEERATRKGGIGRGRISSLDTVLRLLSFPRTVYGDIQQQQQKEQQSFKCSLMSAKFIGEFYTEKNSIGKSSSSIGEV